MAGIEELSPAAGPVATRPPEDEIDDDDDDLDETLVERLWGLTEMFPDTVRTAAEFSAQCSVSLAKKFYRYICFHFCSQAHRQPSGLSLHHCSFFSRSNAKGSDAFHHALFKFFSLGPLGGNNFLHDPGVACGV
uniref:Mitochondrial import receptor subunit TOM22 homolog n=1 Tax=Hippocampus comes TaxID=109280 RepID=A0A3Q3DHD4_HIPCM